MELCPIWVSGEIYIGGKGVGLGYWKNELLTQSSFIIHPRTGEYLYKTGDFGRLHSDGFIEFLGREDTQLKVRGFRVEAGEIEVTLEKYPGVSKAIVLPEESGREKNHLIAYIVPVQSQTQILTEDELKQFSKSQLPDYMQASQYILLDRFPLTSNGKVDRQALAKTKRIKEMKSVYLESHIEDDTLSKVILCVSDILHLDHILEIDNFFNMGATSVDVIRLINRLDQEFNLRLTTSHIYDASNFIDLASIISKKNNATRQQEVSTYCHTECKRETYEVITDPSDREKFKKSKRFLRHDLEKNKNITLPTVKVDPILEEIWQSRRSHRHFLKAKVRLESLSQFLKCLEAKETGDAQRYVYGSAGGLYPVQTYLYVKPNRVTDLKSGIYYYHPIKNTLVSVSEEVMITGKIYDPMINRPIFDEAAFVVFLIADLSAIEPMYGERSTHYATIEAGLISQVLEESAPRSNLGLCQIGELDFDLIKEQFKLSDNHILVHSLLGGKVEKLQ